MCVCQLCLRKWLPVNPGGEFRCFVRNNRLIGASVFPVGVVLVSNSRVVLFTLAISQRDVSAHYEHIVSSKESVREELVTFYQQVVHKRFSNSSCE